MAISNLDILSIGDCSVDYFVVPEKFKTAGDKLILDLAQKIPVKTLELFPGGNALNTAVSFSRLGLKTGIVTELGRDPGAEIILDCIKLHKIDFRFVRQNTGEQTNRSIVIVTEGERTILSYHCEKQYKLAAKIPAKWAYLTSLGAGYDAVYNNLLANKNLKIVYNPGSQQLMRGISAVKKMISRSSLLFVNLDEAKNITKVKSQNVKTLLLNLHKMGAQKIFITDGQKGAFAYNGSNFFRIPIYPAKRVDATGAGDAFASATTAGIIYGKPIDEAMCWGTVMAAHEVSAVGVQNGLLKKSELEKILSRNKKFMASRF